ncbi:Cu(I)-responsive transcriptional regulator [Ottowia oryzae]|uniref:Cu(I)-responsive transcriptional regulator n=1 Tax=Ottowia oryzae TaxID=2109914 RepID=A0A2S0MC40_9BURK|nr:Cu(I)-responsive transcriptional regulator [Ottowia oryzae]AVO33361.1 Cu(I)-responsive transcriptional regulator [Ottowia oryzae]
MTATATGGRRPAATQAQAAGAGAPLPSATQGPVNIGDAARASGVSAKMVRNYESLGLLGAVARTDSGYRQYSAADIHTLRFIKRARDLGFSMAEIGNLVGLWHDQARASSEVKRVAQQHLIELENRIQAMQDMRRTLQKLVQSCQGDDRPDCPILDNLAGGPGCCG